MNIPNYNFKITEPDKTLGLNEYFFVCDSAGHYLKSKNLQEFQEISKWNNIIFSGRVKNNQHIHFKISGTWRKKAFSRLSTSAPVEFGVFDLHLLQTELVSRIVGIKLGGKEKAETYEML